MFLFNVRVYGILLTENEEVLISDERVGHVSFTKFPGGGLEYGEGLIHALKREFLEECAMEIDVVRHIYTTDFYEKSSFNESQIISIYYEVKPSNDLVLDIRNKIFTSSSIENDGTCEKEQAFRLMPKSGIIANLLTFKTDQMAWEVFVNTTK